MGVEDLFKKLSSRMAREGKRRKPPVRVSKVSEEQLTAALGTEYKTLEEVAGVLGITRERVRQLINERGITRVPHPAKTYPTCKVCNQPNSNHRGVEWRSRQFRTHQACTKIILTCPQCDNEFSLRRSDGRVTGQVKRDRIFCSRSCFWLWRWKNDSEYGYSLAKSRRRKHPALEA
jgi:hypothetical protein